MVGCKLKSRYSRLVNFSQPLCNRHYKLNICLLLLGLKLPCYAPLKKSGNCSSFDGSYSVFSISVDLMFLFVIDLVNFNIPSCMTLKSFSFRLIFSRTAPSFSDMTM